MLKKIERVYALVHCDTDGVASAAAIRAAHPEAHVVVEFADYGNIDKLLHKALTRTTNGYDRIVIADISWRPFEEIHHDADARNDVVRHINQAGKVSADQLVFLGVKYSPEEVMLAHSGMRTAIEAYGKPVIVLDHHPRALTIAREYAGVLDPQSILETHDDQGVMRAGSELAARYYLATCDQELPGMDEAVVDFCRLAGDYDVWRDPHGVGGKLAMGVMRLDDNYEALLAMETVIAAASWQPRHDESFDWYQLIKEYGGLLGHYMLEAEAEYEQAKTQALLTLEQRSKHLVEVYATEFSSLISDHIYQNYPVVCVRYIDDKAQVNKISLRTGVKGLDLGAIVKPMGGGGHPAAAGLTIPIGTYEQKLTAIAEALDKELAA